MTKIPLQRRDVPFYLAIEPSRWHPENPDAACPKCPYIFRYAYRRKDGIWRIGAIPAHDRLQAADIAQRAQNPGVTLMYKRSIAGVIAHGRNTAPTAGGPDNGPAAA